MDEEYKGKKIVESSASILGSATGSIVGTFMAGPGAGTVAGAVAGSFLGEVVERVIGEFASRLLSSREQFRVESASKYAIIKIKQLCEEGYRPRIDNFFDTDETNRSSADEIFEGVLLKAKNEHQEKKIKYLGNFFANVAFQSDISIPEANYLLKTAEEISYRQFCFIALLSQKGILNIESLRRREHPTRNLQILQREEWTLHAPYFGVYGLIDGNNAWEDWLNELGDNFYELLGLSEIPREDLDELSYLINLCDDSPLSTRGAIEDKVPPASKRK
jgi:hypothetical protein